MNATFKNLIRKKVLIFFDDILVYSPDMAAHLLDLREVLSIMRCNKLMAKRSKCTFGGSQVEYLGHLISQQGVSTDAKKIEAVVQWPIPQNLKQLRGFLGLAGYYRRLIQSFGSIAKPLTELLEKDSFLWSEAAQVAFETLKQALSSAPVLALPDFTKPFVVETDASSKGLGAVLIQDHHPIAYISKALSTKQLMLSVYERTHQRSLKHLMDQAVTTPLQHSWLAKMQGYSYEIVYKKGVDNVAADALSRIPDTIFVVVDHLTKFAHFMALKHPYTAKQVAQVLMDNIFKMHGCPSSIVSDRDPIFLSRFWKGLMQLQGITLNMSSAYHPQSDGQTEVLNRCLETYLRCMTLGVPQSWDKWLSMAQYCYNTTWHSSIRMTPYQALYGVVPSLPNPLLPRPSNIASVQEFLQERQQLMGILKYSYKELKSLRNHRYSKLSPRYCGPFKILKKIGNVAYHLELPQQAQIHPWEPLAIVDRKLAKNGNVAVVKFLVHWKDQAVEDASWEDASDFQLRFPDFPI
ncbi:hypothetical protein E3N88_40767 [Mikania micrantha]|uniref:Integrase catalytic domain-containing protein n=1 Tax=Mikania micrantha TaxID=192012 RepID=A0A5N6LNH7_9ASTR|nr:hypothetical protein E3N88_40767 [Mikania micrantha]